MLVALLPLSEDPPPAAEKMLERAILSDMVGRAVRKTTLIFAFPASYYTGKMPSEFIVNVVLYKSNVLRGKDVAFHDKTK